MKEARCLGISMVQQMFVELALPTITAQLDRTRSTLLDATATAAQERRTRGPLQQPSKEKKETSR